jgi:hypothetical protein
MHRVLKNLTPFLLAAFLIPVAWSVSGCEARVRYYDTDHRDWHRWDDHEDVAYRGYLSEKHMDYREFNSLNDNEKKDYWNWRHAHPDANKH